jgi:hypothetical protein
MQLMESTAVRRQESIASGGGTFLPCTGPDARPDNLGWAPSDISGAGPHPVARIAVTRADDGTDALRPDPKESQMVTRRTVLRATAVVAGATVVRSLASAGVNGLAFSLRSSFRPDWPCGRGHTQ